jgi:hypothetical protein
MVSTVTIRVQLPHHLRNLARVGKEVSLDVAEPVTLHGVLNTLEKNYPMLRGTIRDHATLKRRPYLRFFTCGQDWSHETPDTPLPEEVLTGKEPVIVLGAIAGG